MPTNEDIKTMIERLNGAWTSSVMNESADMLSALLAEREETYSAMFNKAVNEGGAVLMNSEGAFEHVSEREFYAQQEREWRPIAEYDAMPQKKRPVLAMFRFAATKPTLSQRGFLAETWRCTRDYGSRECISYFPIPLPSPPENE
jgi:hypothetical protein